MSVEFGWRDVAALIAAATVIGGLVIAWVKWRLSGDFASKGDIAGLSDRIKHVESTLIEVPKHEDLRRLGDRLTGVETNVAAMGADLRGVRDGISRMERDVHLLLQHELRKTEGGS